MWNREITALPALLHNTINFPVISLTRSRKDVASIICHSNIFFDFQVSLPKSNGLIHKIIFLEIQMIFQLLWWGLPRN